MALSPLLYSTVAFLQVEMVPCASWSLLTPVPSTLLDPRRIIGVYFAVGEGRTGQTCMYDGPLHQGRTGRTCMYDGPLSARPAPSPGICYFVVLTTL